MRLETHEPIALLVTSAFLLDGAVVSKGDVISVSEDVAKALLRRGKAELATVENTAAAQADVAPIVKQAPASDLDKMTKAELLDMAKELGVAVKANDSKAQVVATLEAAVK